jgi:hypothetical protein
VIGERTGRLEEAKSDGLSSLTLKLLMDSEFRPWPEVGVDNTGLSLLSSTEENDERLVWRFNNKGCGIGTLRSFDEEVVDDGGLDISADVVTAEREASGALEDEAKSVAGGGDDLREGGKGRTG